MYYVYMSVTLTSIRLDTHLADEAVKVLGVKSRTEAVHVALKEIVALQRFKDLMTKNAGKLRLQDQVSNLVVFDTSVLIDQLRTGRHQARIQAVNGLLRTSAVVLSELWRGATTPAEQRVVRALEQNHPVLVPTAKNWLLSGQILGKIRVGKGFGPGEVARPSF